MGTSDTIIADKLLRLLRSRRSERACAAALVLGALRPKDPRVSTALVRRLATLDAPARPYVREALALQKTDEALSHLVLGLLGTGVEREQSRLLLPAFGARVLPHLDRALAERPRDPGSAHFAVAAVMRTRVAAAWLMRHLAAAGPARCLAAYRALRRELRGPYPRPLREFLRARAAACAIGGGAAAPCNAAVAARLLCALGQPSGGRLAPVPAGPPAAQN